MTDFDNHQENNNIVKLVWCVRWMLPLHGGKNDLVFHTHTSFVNNSWLKFFGKIPVFREWNVETRVPFLSMHQASSSSRNKFMKSWLEIYEGPEIVAVDQRDPLRSPWYLSKYSQAPIRFKMRSFVLWRSFMWHSYADIRVSGAKWGRSWL